MKTYIRDYNSTDYSQLMDLWVKTGMCTPGRGDDEIVIQKTLDAGGKLLLLEDKTKNLIIGSSWISNDARRLYLHHFAIHPDYQGKGLSHQLVEESLAFARELNMQIKLEVHQKNEIAKALYAKHGFNYLGDYEVHIIRSFK